MKDRQGLLVSVEGINGVGKTYLTDRALHLDPSPDGVHRWGREVICLDGFSQRSRSPETDLGRAIIKTMFEAAQGDPFLRGGHPASETLLLLAIKAFDWEENAAAYARGAIVLEGRSIHTIAVYQSLIMHPDDDAAALTEAQQILDAATWWRPLPDLTLLITDHTDTAIGRLETRDHRTCNPDQRTIHHRAARLFEDLAATDTTRIVVLDRRAHDEDHLARRIRDLITDRAQLEHLAS